MKIFITGGAGYIGAMLAHQFSEKKEVEKIFLLDKNDLPEILKGNNKLEFFKANTSENSWQSKALDFAPDVVIHTAWQIREMYGDKKTQWLWNVTGSEKVFDFTFSTPSVKKLIYFSTASIYGAFSTNTFEHVFKEDEPLLEGEYLYGVEKKEVENILEKKYKEAQGKGKIPQVFVVRPAAITGPRGRYMMKGRFGLQSALSGNLSGSPIYSFVKLMVKIVPGTKLWCRQFIHEDDVNDIVELLTFKDLKGEYEVFNITPPGKIVLVTDMAKAVGKKVIMLPPFLIRIAFAIFWNLTRGKIPTSKGGWKFYSYPIVMDGSKLTKMFGYVYKYDSLKAFSEIVGRYSKYVLNKEK